MSNAHRPLVAAAAVLGFLGVLLGAFAAHALKDVIKPGSQEAVLTLNGKQAGRYAFTIK